MRHPITIPHHRWALVFAVLCLSLSAGAETLPQVAPEDVGLSSQRLERLTDVMQLQEEGRLLIDDPVSRYLPEFAETTVAIDNENVEGYSVVPADRPITIRDLLTHTAGIGYGPASDRWQAADIQKWYFAHREEPIRATVERMADLPFRAHPGTQFVYGYNTDILGALIEVVADDPLDRFLQERILDPLGMEDTHFYLPRSKQDRLVTVYSASEEGGIERAPDDGTMVSQGQYVEGPRTSFSGGAGLQSTAMDYARFQQALLNGGRLDGQRILSRKTVELMTVDHLGHVEFPWMPGTGSDLDFPLPKT